MSGHARARAGWFVVALLAAALVLAPSAVWPTPLAWLAVVVVLAIAPGAWLARRVLPEAPHDARVALALLLAPFACAVVSSLLRMVLPEPRSAARVLVSVIALLAAAEALRPRQRASTALGERAGWLGAGFVAVSILLAHAANPVLGLRSDGAFHLGVVRAVLQGLPPEDPWFAGLPLRYFWGLHAWAANATALVPTLGPGAVLPVSGAFAAGAAWLAASALVTRLGGGGRTAWGAGVLLLAGTAPFAWLGFVARSLTGATRGAAAWAPAVGDGADAALRALDPGLLHPSLVLPYDKFMVVTPFAWGLAAVLVLAWTLLAMLHEPTPRHAGGVALALAAALTLHPFAGAALGIAAVCGVVVGLGARAFPMRTGAFALAALALGAVVLLPPVRMFAPAAEGGASAVAWAPSGRALVSVLFGGAVLLPFAFAALRATARKAGSAGSAVLGGMLAALVLPALVLRFGGDNQSKFLNLAFALAAPLAAVGVAHWASSATRRRLALGFACAAWLPTLMLLDWAYVHERDSSSDAPSSPPRAILAALAREALPDAVVVDATLDPRRGAAPAVPAVTGRALLWSGAFMARKWGHPAAELAVREHVAAALAQGQWPEGRDGAWLTATGREVWLIAPGSLAPAAAIAMVVARMDGVQLVRFKHP